MNSNFDSDDTKQIQNLMQGMQDVQFVCGQSAHVLAKSAEEAAKLGYWSAALNLLDQALILQPDAKQAHQRVMLALAFKDKDAVGYSEYLWQRMTRPSLAPEDISLAADFLRPNAPALAKRMDGHARLLQDLSATAQEFPRLDLSEGLTDFHADSEIYVAGDSRPHSLIYYAMPWAGTAAIFPIVGKILANLHYENVGPHTDWYPVLMRSPGPVYMGNHFELSHFQSCVHDERYRFLCLTRDPRDAVVSEAFTYLYDRHIDATNCSIEELRATMTEVIISNYPERLRIAKEWRNLDDDRCLKLTFEETIRDVPSMVFRILDFLKIEVSESLVRSICDEFSYERVTGRKRGQTHSGSRHAHGTFARTGTSGAWKSFFDPTMRRIFDERSLGVLQEWGYETNTTWVDAQDNATKHLPNRRAHSCD